MLTPLLISNFTQRRIRVALTVAAIALAVSLVVSVTTGYASFEAAARKFLAMFMGTVDAQITRTSDPVPGFSQSLLDEIRRDPDVRLAVGRLETESIIIAPDGQPLVGRAVSIYGVEPRVDETIARLPIHFGRWFQSSDETVIDKGLVRRIHEEKLERGDITIDELCQQMLGQTIWIPRGDSRLPLRIVGVAHKPTILQTALQTIYVPLESLQRFIHGDDSAKLTKINVEFELNVDASAFASRWRERLAQIDPLLRLRLIRDTRAEMDRNLLGMRLMSYMGGAVSMLAATFIVFSTLSMGVTERQRTLAMLRAIGALRRQIGRLVLAEGLLLASLGVALGVPLGWLWVKLLAMRFEGLFAAGVVFDVTGAIVASVGMLIAAALASLLPAWTAARVDPLEAMAPLAKSPRSGPPLGWAMLGLGLISLDSILLFAPIGPILSLAGAERAAQYGREVSFYGHFIIGLPVLMLGFFLLSPLVVWIIERLGVPLVAPMLWVRAALLRQQFSGGLWRAAGTAAALMVGLAVLTVSQTQGNSALSSWQLPDRFPDVFIFTTSFSGMDDEAQTRITEVPGIDPDSVMPISMFSPELAMLGNWSIAGAAVMPNATMFFGVDPDKAFDLMHLDFRAGNRDNAQRMLSRGQAITLTDGSVLHASIESEHEDSLTILDIHGQRRELERSQIGSIRPGHYVVVTEEFRKLRRLQIGDVVNLRSRTKGRVDFIIVGSVWSPGLDVMASTFDLGRQFEQRTASSLFGTLQDSRDLFGVQSVHLLAANLAPNVDKRQVIAELRQSLGDRGVSLADVRQLKHDIQRSFQRLLLAAGTVAWAAMAVASLGVTNTIMASIRTRRWQFGVLRSIGVTRGLLLRIVLAEAILLGLVATALGLSAGLLMTLNARQLSRLVMGFEPPLAIPWTILGIGVGVVMLISILASLIPAISVARAQPLSLLQAGRAAA